MMPLNAMNDVWQEGYRKPSSRCEEVFSKSLDCVECSVNQSTCVIGSVLSLEEASIVNALLQRLRRHVGSNLLWIAVAACASRAALR